MIALQVQQFRDISRRSIFAKLAPFPNSLGPLFDRDLFQSFGRTGGYFLVSNHSHDHINSFDLLEELMSNKKGVSA